MQEQKCKDLYGEKGPSQIQKNINDPKQKIAHPAPVPRLSVSGTASESIKNDLALGLGLGWGFIYHPCHPNRWKIA